MPPSTNEEECTRGVRCTGRDPSNSHKPNTTHAPRRTLRTSRPKRITPRRTKKPDERGKTFREAEQAPVSATANNKRQQATSGGHNFHDNLPLGNRRQLARKSKPSKWQLTEGHAFRKAPSTREAQATRRRVEDNLKAFTRGTWRNAPVEFAAQAGIRPTRTNRTQLTRHDVHCAPAPQNESPPEGPRSPTNARKHLERPSKHRLARMQITNATGKFRGTYFSQQASTRKA